MRIYDSVLMSGSVYKSLIISEITTVRDVIRLLFRCYNLEGRKSVESYEMTEVCPGVGPLTHIFTQTVKNRSKKNWQERNVLVITQLICQDGCCLRVLGLDEYPVTVQSNWATSNSFVLRAQRRLKTVSGSSNFARNSRPPSLTESVFSTSRNSLSGIKHKLKSLDIIKHKHM